jgi:acyl-CoA thioester hydrolase
MALSDHPVYRTRLGVRVYELDTNGHVNNAVYLNYAEHVATEHAEALGFGRAWTLAHGGTWVVRRHEITFHQPAVYADELELTTRVEIPRGARGVRHTSIVRVADQLPVADVVTEWVWVKLANGRPARVPPELIAAFSPSARPETRAPG